ncbi:TRIC cation channel family protein [Streptomyces murinus]|uniref:TRIC cation channel family protein n=1 Tax=Streptomyces murinus TaxID=33900 RepID=UPI003F474B5C
MTVIATRSTVHAGASAPAVLILAVLSGTAGEIVRDLLCGRRLPQLLHEEIYTLTSLTGATAYLVSGRAGFTGTAPTALSAALVFALRMTAVRLDLHLPRLGHRQTVYRDGPRCPVPPNQGPHTP